MANVARNRIHSTWTPLNNEDTNQKIFEERRTLVGKWFDKWSHSQRKQVLSDLLGKCKLKQIEFTGDLVSKKRPVYHDDFTKFLPRVLSLYIFSFLDPRSLCRSSQVSWYWKYLTELDQIWMAKCVRLGWILTFSPSPYETGVWKRFYIENIVALKCLIPKMPTDIPLKELDGLSLEKSDSKKKTPRGKSWKRPPWKGSDPVPQDTWRNNYLENDDEIEKVNKLRRRGLAGHDSDEILRRVKTKIQTGLLSKNNPSMTRSKSSPGINLNGITRERPDWAKQTAGNLSINQSHAGDPATSHDASIRPSPVKTLKFSHQRSTRDPPTTDLFTEKPWRVPTGDEMDSPR